MDVYKAQRQISSVATAEEVGGVCGSLLGGLAEQVDL